MKSLVVFDMRVATIGFKLVSTCVISFVNSLYLVLEIIVQIFDMTGTKL